jgi:SAM-dependent methyltransferase
LRAPTFVSSVGAESIYGGSVMEWSGGYVADIGYTADFYRETAPSHLAFAALSVGRSPGRAFQPRRYLELGFGQGFGLALLAAANPDVEFEGYDFNPEHVAHARRLIHGAGLANASVSEISFEEAAARGGDNDLDVVALHGILSWVGQTAQEAIVEVLRQRVQPEGIVYASYNCMPGWAPLLPIRQFMLQVKHSHATSSDRQVALALDLLGKLKDAHAHYFAANPAAEQQLDRMRQQDRAYLAHEFLHEHWDLFPFADLAARLAAAKLNYVASATLPENFDHYAVPQALAPLVAESGDPIMRETLRDYASNKRFRRDVFARGSTAPMTAAEHRRMLSGLRFALAVPRDKVVLAFDGPLMKMTGRANLYGPILDALVGRIAEFDELAAAFPLTAENRLAMLLDCLCLLVHSGQVLPIIGAAGDPEPAKRFNRMVVEHSREGRFYFCLASPVARTGIRVGEFALWALAADLDGAADNAETAARHALAGIKSLGRRPARDGKLIQDDEEAVPFIADNIAPVIDGLMPIWRQLGVW